MEFYIDLSKSMLNFAKLTKKMVQVRGKNGKIFTRMQWVAPDEASTGHGFRTIRSERDMSTAMKHGIHHHPQYEQAKTEQGIHHTTHDFQKHPEFHLPETAHSAHMANRDKVDNHTPHKEVSEQAKPKPGHMSDEEVEAFQRKHGIHPEIHSVIKDAINTLDPEKFTDDSPSHLLSMAGYGLEKHEHTIKKHVEEHIKSSTDDEFVRNVQIGALKNGDMHLVALHPQIAKHTLDKILGKNLADKFRKDLDVSTLSVNFPGMHRDSIQKDGYTASTMHSYIERRDGEAGLKELDKILNSGKTSHEMVRDLYEFDPEVGERADAEYTAVGLKPTDRKPTYIALNHNNRPDGAAPYYGNRWMKITDEDNVLNHCTATYDDSFATTKSIAKVFSKDHLKDMFIMKMVSKHPDMKYIVKHGEEDYPEWHAYAGEIPIELQYHQPKLNPDQFTIPSALGELKSGGGEHWDAKYPFDEDGFMDFDTMIELGDELGMKPDDPKMEGLIQHLEGEGKPSSWISQFMPEKLDGKSAPAYDDLEDEPELEWEDYMDDDSDPTKGVEEPKWDLDDLDDLDLDDDDLLTDIEPEDKGEDTEEKKFTWDDLLEDEPKEDKKKKTPNFDDMPF